MAGAYLAALRPRAIVVTGSAATGIADRWSDLDLVVYHDELPAESAIAAARRRAGGGEANALAPWDGQAFIESFPLRGVECQVAHGTVAGTERRLDQVLVGLDVDSPFQKAMDGLQHSVTLHDTQLVARWRRRLEDYPDALCRAMVERHLRFSPLWVTDQRLAVRDATLFRQQMLVDSSLNLLAVLAGLNRVYFSAFQFRRLRAFAGRLASRPADLADRLDALFTMPERAAVQLESLVADTVALVERELPDVDTSRARRWVGRRAEPWQLDR